MSRGIQFLIFFLMFFTLSLVLHIYIFFHISFMFSIEHNLWFWLFILVSSASYILAMVLGFEFGNRITQVLSIVASVWTGFVFILLFTLFGYDILRFFMHLDAARIGPWIIAGVTIASVFGVINAQLIRIKKIRLPATNLKKTFKIVHLSDLHIGPIHGRGYLRNIVKKTNALEPDLVLITGDLADGAYRYTTKSFAGLNDLKAPVFFSLGNHEYYAGLDEVLELLAKTKVKVLRNEKINHKQLQIVGVDYAWGRETVPAILSKLKLDQKKYTILMYHMPINPETANKFGVNLVLSGHTHGGQFFPFVLLAKIFWKYGKGLYRHKGTYLFTTTGTGTWGPPMRLGTNSEIAEISLTGR